LLVVTAPARDGRSIFLRSSCVPLPSHAGTTRRWTVPKMASVITSATVFVSTTNAASASKPKTTGQNHQNQ